MLIKTRIALWTRAISSVMIVSARNPKLLPPQSSGSVQPKNPSSPIFSTRSRRKRCSRSSSAALGAISFSANSRASSRTAASSSLSSKFMALLLLQQMLRDDEFLNLGGSLVNPERAHVTVKALDGIARNDAHAAVNLQRLVDDALRRLGGEELSH